MIWSVFCSLPYLAVSSIVSLRAVLLSEALQPFFLLWFSSWFLLFLQQAAQISSFPEVFPSCGTQPCVPHIALQLSHGPQDMLACLSAVCQTCCQWKDTQKVSPKWVWTVTAPAAAPTWPPCVSSLCGMELWMATGAEPAVEET